MISYPTILYIGNEEIIINVLRRYILEEIHFIVADNITDAVEALRNFHVYGLILEDSPSGRSTYRHMKWRNWGTGKFFEVPTIVIEDPKTGDIRDLVEESAIVHFIPRPFYPRVLAELVITLLRRSRTFVPRDEVARLNSKVALVTGAARGIGRGIARRFAVEGACVGILDLDAAACQAVVDETAAVGGTALEVAADISEPTEVEAAVAKLRNRFGAVTILVNNAAVMPAGAIHETDVADFDRCLAVNLRGTFLVSRAVIPGMLAAGRGSIIHMASITGLLGLPGIAAYSMTKGALIALTRAMSTDYAARGIRTNSVSPGTIDSPMLHDFLAAQANPEALRREYDVMHPIGRVGTIDEVANVCLFLASDEASFVTGSNYEVDGGLSSKGEQPQD